MLAEPLMVRLAADCLARYEDWKMRERDGDENGNRNRSREMER